VAGCRGHHGPAAAAAGSAGVMNTKEELPPLVRRGKLLFDETPKYAPEYVGNKLACGDCHVQSGTAKYAAPMIDLAGLFPMFNKRAGHVISLQNRIQECFSRSEAGRPLPLDSATMKAMVAYIDWLSKDGVKGKAYQGRGFVKLPALKGDAVAGKKVYVAQCAACHGSNGAGVPPILPAVWGKDSYNDGAGMNNPTKMAAFLVHNMPQNHPGTLTPQQAYDVSAYVHAQPRPKFNQAYKGY
ncbi:MAG TPA: c-type cytochrome, partial [Terracidiphilus sp.]|nr:c-type cytochrome [Terracidiphilus sp.]